MGDNLAEELYRVFVNASGLVAGSGDVPNWASMPIAQREVWQQVAAKARKEMSARFLTSIDAAEELADASHTEIMNGLRARWSSR